MTPTKVSPALKAITSVCMRTDCGLSRSVSRRWTRRNHITTAGNIRVHTLSTSSTLIGGLPVSRHVSHDATDDHEEQGHIPASADRFAKQSMVEFPAEHGTGFAHHRCGEDPGCRWVSHPERNTTDGFTFTYAVPGRRHTEHRHGVCSNSSSHGASPRDPISCSALSSDSACNACSSFRPPSCSGSSALCTPSLYA